MNTYERHRVYQLRRNRTRIIRRRVLSVLGVAVLVLAAWSVVSRLTPDAYAPPAPTEVGAAAAKGLARTAAQSINAVHGTLQPDYRDEAKRSVYAIFDGTAVTPRDPDDSAVGSASMTEIRDPDRTHAASTGDPADPGPGGEADQMREIPHPIGGGVSSLDSPEVFLSSISDFFADSATRRRTAAADSHPAKTAAQDTDAGSGARVMRFAAASDADARDPDADARDLDDGAITGDPATIGGGDRTHRVLDVLLIGLDSRLGNARGRADALHLVTVDLDAPSVRITSIPRGTYSDLGYKSEQSNIIANVRAARGRGELLRRVARMCRRDSVPFYAEVGFSDAFGILELLGYEDPVAELQALRQRRRYQYGDHNRCYNQGLFVRSAILRLLPLLEGVTGDVLLRAGLDLVHTNLTREQCRGIAYILNDAGLTRLPGLITVTLRSRFRRHIEREVTGATYAHAVPGIDYDDLGGRTDAAERQIRAALSRAAARSDAPRSVHEELMVMFRQHGWLQIRSRPVRRLLRDSLATLLISACRRLGYKDDLEEIRRTVQADDLLFHQRELSRSGVAAPRSSAAQGDAPPSWP